MVQITKQLDYLILLYLKQDPYYQQRGMTAERLSQSLKENGRIWLGIGKKEKDFITSLSGRMSNLCQEKRYLRQIRRGVYSTGIHFERGFNKTVIDLSASFDLRRQNEEITIEETNLQKVILTDEQIDELKTFCSDFNFIDCKILLPSLVLGKMLLN